MNSKKLIGILIVCIVLVAAAIIAVLATTGILNGSTQIVS